MSFELALNLVPLNVDELDFSIAASHSNLLARLIEFANMGNGVASIQIAHLLDHPDVPNLEYTIRVTRGHILTPN